MAAFLVTFAALNLVVPRLLPTAPSLPSLLCLELLLLTLALSLSDLIAALPLAPRDLEYGAAQSPGPRVAVLYLVKDDLVPYAFSRLGRHTYANYDTFVLDDSASRATRDRVDASPFRVVRRRGREGNKAGNLNHWLRLYGADYKYFLLLDSDSVTEDALIDDLVRYAEHPANQRVAIFNTLPGYWNTKVRFARLTTAATPLDNWVRVRLANRSPTTFSTGHNNLHRTDAVLAAGGFDETVLAEDIALTIALLRIGYTSKLVRLVAYEAEPENIFAYTRRLRRWAGQTVQVHRLDWAHTPLSVRYRLFRLSWTYATLLAYPLWILYLAWGWRSSPGDVHFFLDSTAGGGWASALRLAGAFALPLLGPLARVPLCVRTKTPVRLYALHWVVSLAIGLYAMTLVAATELSAVFRRTLSFTVTDKVPHRIVFTSLLRRNAPFVCFFVVLVAGFSRNLVGLMLAAPWMVGLLLTPVVLYLAHDPESRGKDQCASPPAHRVLLDATGNRLPP